MFILLCTIIINLVFYIHNGTMSSYTNFEIKRFELCNDTQGIIPFYGIVSKDSNGNQYINYNVSLPHDLDENIGQAFSIYSRTVKTHFVEVFTIREKNFCKAANIYMGEFWYDLERAAQVTPGICPIRAGRYNVHHALLDFKKITLQTFPFGRLRFILKLVDNRNPNIKLLCLLIEVENHFD